MLDYILEEMEGQIKKLNHEIAGAYKVTGISCLCMVGALICLQKEIYILVKENDKLKKDMKKLKEEE